MCLARCVKIRGAFRTDLQELNKAIATTRKALQRQRKQTADLWVTAFQWMIAVTIFLLSGWTDDAALVFLEHQLSNKRDLGTDTPSAETLRERLQKLVLAADLDFLLRLQNPNSKRGKLVHAKAVRFLASREVAKWVEVQNAKHGLAPSLLQSAQRFVDAAKQVVVGFEGASRLEQSIEDGARSHDRARAVRYWGHSFRRKWGLKYGCLRAHSVADPEQVRRQVAGLLLAHMGSFSLDSRSVYFLKLHLGLEILLAF